MSFGKYFRVCRTSSKISSFILIAIFLFSTSIAFVQEAHWTQEAAINTQDEFNSVKKSVGETLTLVSRVDLAADNIITQLTGLLADAATSDEDRQKYLVWISNINEGKEAMKTQQKTLEFANSQIGNAATAFDAVVIANEFSDSEGNFDDYINLLGSAMEVVGGKLPSVLGDAVKGYGTITKGMIQATKALETKLQSNARQSTLNMNNNLDNMVNQFISQYGQDVAQGLYLQPNSTAPFVYSEEATGNNTNESYIWDATNSTWTKVNLHPSKIADLYQSYVLGKGRPTADVLIGLSTNYDKVESRIENAKSVRALWNDMINGGGRLVFDNVDFANALGLRNAMTSPNVFAARFAHDLEFNKQVKDWLKVLEKEALTQGAGFEDVLAQIKAVNQALGIASSEIKRSVVFVLDASGSMGDDNRMVEAKASAESTLNSLSADTEVALIAFFDCNNIRVLQGFTQDVASVISALQSVQPSGSTPIAAAIRFSKSYIKSDANSTSADLILLSDGEETCSSQSDAVNAAREE